MQTEFLVPPVYILLTYIHTHIHTYILINYFYNTLNTSMHTYIVWFIAFLCTLQMNLRSVVMSNLSKFSNSCNYPSTYTFSTFTQPNNSNNNSNSSNNNNNENEDEDKDRPIRSGRSPLLPSTSELFSDNEESESESENENENEKDEDENQVGKAFSTHSYVTKFNAVRVHNYCCS